MDHSGQRSFISFKKLHENDALRLPIVSLKNKSVTDFDLYIKVERQLSLYASSPYVWRQDEIDKLIKHGYADFYYSKSDHAKVEAYQRLKNLVVDSSLPPAQRISAISDAAAELTKILYEQGITDAIVTKGGEIAGSLVDCVREDVTSIQALGQLANHDAYTYYHSARVAAYALAIAVKISPKDDGPLRDLSLGCIFHDIGKSQIDLMILNKPGKLTDEEMDKMRQHPVFGDEITNGSKLSHISREIILHHHEKIDGGGYPHHLQKGELLPEVRIAAFADLFDALTTNRPYQQGRTRFEALELIKSKLLKQYDLDAYKALVEILHEKP